MLERLSDLFVARGVPEHIRSDNGPEFTPRRCGVAGPGGSKTLYIEPGSPWENGYIESFNGKLWDELLDGEVFDTLLEAKVLVDDTGSGYNPCGRTARSGTGRRRSCGGAASALPPLRSQSSTRKQEEDHRAPLPIPQPILS